MVPSPYYENRLYCNTGWNRQGPSFPSKASADPKGQEEKGQQKEIAQDGHLFN